MRRGDEQKALRVNMVDIVLKYYALKKANQPNSINTVNRLLDRLEYIARKMSKTVNTNDTSYTSYTSKQISGLVVVFLDGISAVAIDDCMSMDNIGRSIRFLIDEFKSLLLGGCDHNGTFDNALACMKNAVAQVRSKRVSVLVEMSVLSSQIAAPPDKRPIEQSQTAKDSLGRTAVF